MAPRLLLSMAGAALLSASSNASILVTGATGHTGSLIYNRLRQDGIDVRAFVRNATKAKERLNCSACDESDGVFVGDLKEPATLVPAMDGVSTLIIATASAQICNYTTFACHYPDGGWPVDVEWNGGRNQIAAFGNATQGQDSAHVVLLSTALTTLEKVLNATNHPGQIYHYKLNLEAALMASGIGFTIVKPCGLANGEAGQKRLETFHDDALYPFPKSGIVRADVARIVAEAAQEPAVSRGLRFDVCAAADGEPTSDEDLKDLLLSARYPWQQPKLQV